MLSVFLNGSWHTSNQDLGPSYTVSLWNQSAPRMLTVSYHSPACLPPVSSPYKSQLIGSTISVPHTHTPEPQLPYVSRERHLFKGVSSALLMPENRAVWVPNLSIGYWDCQGTGVGGCYRLISLSLCPLLPACHALCAIVSFLPVSLAGWVLPFMFCIAISR